MEVGKLTVEYRKDLGKGMTRKLRTTGKIPAVCYGGGVDPITLAIDPAKLLKALDPVKKGNTVLALTIENAPEGHGAMTVMVRDVQKDPVRGDLTHADFIRVSMDKDVHAVVPVIIVGKAVGVKEGGILHHNIRNLEIACTPDKIPAKVEVDITELGMGDAIHVSDLKLGEGIRALADSHSTICSVTAPRIEKVEAVAEVAPDAAAAAAAAAPGAKGAAAPAAAAGAKGAAAPAAAGAKGAAPAAAEKKK